jgi:hypothetical protein
VKDENDDGVAPAQLADRIKRETKWKKRDPITIKSCNTGKGPGSFGEQVGGIMGTDVTAPDAYWMVMGGEIDFVAEKNWMGGIGDKGHWVTFKCGCEKK